MWETIRKEWPARIATLLFIFFTVWWIYNNFVIGNDKIRYDTFFDFGGTYGIMALWGAFWGIRISLKWGGFRSVIGRAIMMFSIGLLAQEFGQLSYALYYDIYKTPGPYPSLGDIGFFGSIPFYTYGVLLLAKASGVTIKLQSFLHKLQAILIPLVILTASYLFFLQNYTFDWSNPLKVFLDFGYPLAQAFYVSLALLTYLLSRGVLGGIMKSKVLFILFALAVQFFSDYMFLYQSSQGTYQVGGVNDYVYFCAYFLMTLALIQLGTVLTKLRQG